MSIFGFQPSVPWVPTRDEVVEKLLKLIKPKPGDTVYDLGCGDGRIAVSIAKAYPHARVKCLEVRQDLVEKARANAREHGANVDIIRGDFFSYKIGDADIIYMYLLTSVNQKLRPKLEQELHPGTVVVTLDFPIPEWREVARLELPRSWQRVLYVYIVGYSDRPSGEEDHEALRRGVERINLDVLPPDARERILKLLGTREAPRSA
jgi:SAM-dependent methyltransferase